MSETDIWAKCPRTRDISLVENEVRAFLRKFGLEDEFPVQELELEIFHSPPGKETAVFDRILDRMSGGTLADLLEFDTLFRQKFFAHVPQRVLGGQSPVRYALFLKKMRDGE